MNNTPEDLRLVMIDPKMVELVRFNGLPHLFGKVVITSYSIHYTKLYDFLRCLGMHPGVLVSNVGHLKQVFIQATGLRITSYNVCYTKLLRWFLHILA